MMYFVGCKNADEIDERYKQWVKILHPDKGGNTEHFQAMQQEYNDIKTGKVKRKKVVKEQPKHEPIVQNEENLMNKSMEFINMTNNLITMVRSGITLAREINTLIEIDKNVEEIKKQQ